jgi:hypothetical protein
MRLLAISAALSLTGCSPVADVGGYPPDAGTGADTDTDVDTDSDTDTDTEWPPSQTTPATCAEAEELLTSMGCEFFAVDLDLWGGQDWCDLTGVDASTFAIIVANPQEEATADFAISTRVDESEMQIYDSTLAPAASAVVHVTGDCADCLLPDRAVQTQGLGLGRAFRIESNVPVLAFQWNPYDDSNEGEASLLLPTAALGTTYLAQTWRVGDDCGSGDGSYDNGSEITVVATVDGTSLTVTPERDDIPALNGVGPVDAGTESASIALDALDIASFAAATSGPVTIPDDSTYHGDLTGTLVAASAPIAVFGGHLAGYVPTTSASDITTVSFNHLEEQLLPYSAWGVSAVLARHAVRPLLAADEDPVLWRVVAGADGMTVTFEPPLPTPWGASHHFASRGEVLEFVSDVSHVATGALDEPPGEDDGAPFLAYHLMSAAVGTSGQGDGMMLIAAPIDQFLDRYVFSTSVEADYDYDYIILVKRPPTLVRVDCMGLVDQTEFSPIGGSGWEVAWIHLDSPTIATLCADGPQLVQATEPVGVSVVGTAEAGAYGFLAGTGIAEINPVIE